MRYRNLGSSDLVVSEISLGSWLSFGEGETRRNHIACFHRALDLGVNLFDTANVYGFGESERLVREALAHRPRDSYVLATKLWGPMKDGDRGLSRAQVFKQIDGSLQRLGTDHVDLYQCHRYDDDTPLEETMEALSTVVRQGKVRYLGFSEWPADKIRAAQAMVGAEPFVSSQPQYSLLWRDPEAEIFPICRAEGIGQLIWSPLAQGVLTGRYAVDAGPPGGLRGASVEMSKFVRLWFNPTVLGAVQRLRPLADEAGLTLGQFAIAWTLRGDLVTSAIIGASRPEQVDENVAAAQNAVDPALFEAAELIVGAALAEAAKAPVQ
jgi:aryl-alcohol dehydrogenase-like predicted oxidoreductase